ncbi:MAG: hypothetical protein GXO25_01455 [Euryarchaeota archaeon]|nr:hypothetical protein [Euryarchaeota archaeon]
MNPYLLTNELNETQEIAKKLKDSDKKTRRLYIVNFLLLILLSIGMFAVIVAIALMHAQHYLIYLAVYTLLALSLMVIIIIINIVSAVKRRELLNNLKMQGWIPITSPFDDPVVLALMLIIVLGTLGTIFLFSVLAGDFGDPVLITGILIVAIMGFRTVHKRNMRRKKGYPIMRYFNVSFEDAMPRILKKLEEFNVLEKFKGASYYRLKIMGPALDVIVYRVSNGRISVEIKPVKEENLIYAKKVAENITAGISLAGQKDDAQL